MTWRFREPRLEPGDKPLSCPECGSRHARSLAIIRSAVIRDGRYLSLATGDVVACCKCGHQYATSDEGTFRLHVNAAAQTTATEGNSNGPKQPSRVPVLRQPPSV